MPRPGEVLADQSENGSLNGNTWITTLLTSHPALGQLYTWTTLYTQHHLKAT